MSFCSRRPLLSPSGWSFRTSRRLSLSYWKACSSYDYCFVYLAVLALMNVLLTCLFVYQKLFSSNFLLWILNVALGFHLLTALFWVRYITCRKYHSLLVVVWNLLNPNRWKSWSRIFCCRLPSAHFLSGSTQYDGFRGERSNEQPIAAHPRTQILVFSTLRLTHSSGFFTQFVLSCRVSQSHFEPLKSPYHRPSNVPEKTPYTANLWNVQLPINVAWNSFIYCNSAQRRLPAVLSA